MKRSIIFIITITCIYLSTASCKQKETEAKNNSTTSAKGVILWHSFNEGIKKAKQENKPVVIDFYADWCSWCKVMDEKTFSVKEIADTVNNRFIAIRVDTQDTSQKIIYKKHTLSVQEFASFIGVKGLPTVVFLKADGQLITKVPGYIKKEVFLPLIEYVHGGCYEKEISFEEYLKEGKPCI